MRKEKILFRLRDCVVNFDRERIKEVAKEAMEAGIPAYEAVMEGMAKGMEIVGEKYESREYFLAELLMAGETMKEGLEILAPYMKTGEAKAVGTVVIGTVEGDLHDLGKNLIVILLESAGFHVYDLGIDVPAKRFVEKVKETNADILGMSALLTITLSQIEKVIQELRIAGLREKVKVIVGGAPVTENLAKEAGADAYAEDAVVGTNICKRWMIKE